MSLTVTAQRTGPELEIPAGPGAGISGQYEVLEELERRHVIAVCKAWDLQHGRAVALKVILGEGLSEEQLQPIREALHREAGIAARLTHPCIVSVMGTAEDSAGNPYIVMNFVEGETLEQGLEPGRFGEPVSLAKRLEIGIEIADALEYMHRRGVVHRDIKPSNILLTEHCHPCIIDFGIAMLMDGEASLHGVLPGTPAFVAPELLNDSPANARSDIFSFGVLLYWMFTGKIPFPGDSVTEITDNVAHSEPPPVQQHNWALPRDLDRVLGRSLAKDPSKRYAAARELSCELTDLRRAYGSSLLESIPAAAKGIRNVAPVETSPANTVSLPEAVRAAQNFFKPQSGPQVTAPPAHPLRITPPAGFGVEQEHNGSLRKHKNYSAAIRACRESLAIAQELFGSDHPKVADLLGQLAVLCHKEGSYAEAVELHCRALRIRTSDLGGWNEKVATSLNNLALLYRDQGRMQEAQKLLEHSLAMVERIFGLEHPKTALRLSNLADLLYVQSEYDQAEQFYSRLARMLEKGQMSVPRSEVVSSLNNYSALLRRTKRTEDANQIESLIQAAKNRGPFPSI
jgi:serine/threonine protein kinase